MNYRTIPLLLLMIVPMLRAQTEPKQCLQSTFSGEATQSREFKQELGEEITFRVFPMNLGEHPKWRWFQISVVGKGSGFVFHISDRNWFLATDFHSAFIGGPHSDVKTALGYLRRDFLLPLSADDMVQLRQATNDLHEAKTEAQVKSATLGIAATHLGQLRFTITDYKLADGEPATAVDSVSFTGEIILPATFQLSPDLFSRSTYVSCPAIPDEVFENIRDLKRHDYFLDHQRR